MTINPNVGAEGLEPFVERAERYGRGVFVLVKTSNPGSGDLQDREVDGAPLYEAVAGFLEPISARLSGPRTGWSSLGIVVGANYPAQAERIREHLPRAIFLVPGYGAQGGSAVEAVAGFSRGKRALEGGIVNSARGLLFPGDAHTDDAASWEKAFDAGLDEAIRELGQAVAWTPAG